jgi:hypothetical protein
LHADLVALGYDGSYNRVAAFARDWKAARQQERQTCGRGVFVPLAFPPGEAFQFDWSEDWAVIAGERTKLQVSGRRPPHQQPMNRTHSLNQLGDRHLPRRTLCTDFKYR